MRICLTHNTRAMKFYYFKVQRKQNGNDRIFSNFIELYNLFLQTSKDKKVCKFIWSNNVQTKLSFWHKVWLGIRKILMKKSDVWPLFRTLKQTDRPCLNSRHVLL